MLNVLFLCTGNSCRSIMAEGLLNHFGQGRLRAFSAGSHPTGHVNPMSLVTLKAHGINTDGYRSKSWNELGTQHMNAVITVCDSAAGETCPVFFGAPVKAHWSVSDPAHFQGSETETQAEFDRVFGILERRIRAMVELPDNMDRVTFTTKLRQIGTL